MCVCAYVCVPACVHVCLLTHIAVHARVCAWVCACVLCARVSVRTRACGQVLGLGGSSVSPPVLLLWQKHSPPHSLE